MNESTPKTELKDGEKKTTKQKEEGKVKEWNDIVQTSRKTMTQECICSICREIVVRATIANPCGHFFCSSCIHNKNLQRKVCPNCRAGFTSTTRSIAMDNVISGMVMRGDFRCDDFFQY